MISNVLSGGKTRNVGISEVAAYASGGFPATGSLFVANEAGPEMVGRIGNRNAVANTDQITDAIAGAVYEAIIAALTNNSGGEAPIYITLNGKVVAEAMREEGMRFYKSTGKEMFQYGG